MTTLKLGDLALHAYFLSELLRLVTLYYNRIFVALATTVVLVAPNVTQSLRQEATTRTFSTIADLTLTLEHTLPPGG
jgi:hypothetical protein